MITVSRIFIMTIALAASVSAQWFNYPTAGLPRTRDGKPNLAAPTPKTADGKPDLSGSWIPTAGFSHFLDLAADFEAGTGTVPALGESPRREEGGARS